MGFSAKHNPSYLMAEYKKQYRAGGSRPFQKQPFAQKELFDAECNGCHARCQVPFRPNGKKPVYCSNCFTKNDARPSPQRSDSGYRPGVRPERSYSAPVPDRQIDELKRQIEAMHATLQQLVTTVDTFNRATALTLEIQKHFPKEESAPAKKPVAKKAPAKAAKKAPAKKAAKK